MESFNKDLARLVKKALKGGKLTDKDAELMVKKHSTIDINSILFEMLEDEEELKEQEERKHIIIVDGLNDVNDEFDMEAFEKRIEQMFFDMEIEVDLDIMRSTNKNYKTSDIKEKDKIIKAIKARSARMLKILRKCKVIICNDLLENMMPNEFYSRKNQECEGFDEIYKVIEYEEARVERFITWEGVDYSGVNVFDKDRKIKPMSKILNEINCIVRRRYIYVNRQERR